MKVSEREAAMHPPECSPASLRSKFAHSSSSANDDAPEQVPDEDLEEKEPDVALGNGGWAGWRPPSWTARLTWMMLSAVA